MYEAEVNHSIERIESVPWEIRNRFAEYRDRIIARTNLQWGEHCTECVWPTCYTTCELYSPRQDGACRQFIHGVVRIDHKEGLSPYLQKIRFKQWAKLWTVGNLRLEPLSKAETEERINIAVGAIARNAPLPAPIKRKVLAKINYLRRQPAENTSESREPPDCFLLECYNPNVRSFTLTLTLRLAQQKQAPQFQRLITIEPGYTRERILFFELSQTIDTTQAFEIEIVPNDCEDSDLYFGLMDFVKERCETSANNSIDVKPKKLKCIVWDLDNTVWDGVLVEDGPERIRIRQGVVEVIELMDQRGILNSIASKNSHDDAMQILRAVGLDEYFLYPQIGWRPKSQSIHQIAQLLNIDVDTIAFVDDQEFERIEVSTALPQVKVIDAVDFEKIPSQPECNVPITPESRSRRLMYRQQEHRATARAAYSGDYIAFLKDCRLELGVNPLTDTNIKRVYELAQRTNQLNFTGNRYSEEQLREIKDSNSLLTFVIDCKDRFGSYGIVGFGIVDHRVPRLIDLMFSCRIQSKRVEHAVLCVLLKRFLGGGKQDFHATYRRTSKNAACGKVLEEMGFERVAEQDGVESFLFRADREIPDDQIVQIRDEVSSPVSLS